MTNRRLTTNCAKFTTCMAWLILKAENAGYKQARVAQMAKKVSDLLGPVLFPSLLLSYFGKWPKSSKKVLS